MAIKRSQEFLPTLQNRKRKMVRATHTTKCYKTLFHDPVKQKPRHVMKTYSQQKQKREKEERVKL